MLTDYIPKDARIYLQEELAVRKERRPQYSLRAFARDLEMSPSSLSEFLSGRQGMSRERALAIGQKLRFTEQQAEHFWDLIELEFARSDQERKAAKARIVVRSKSDKGRLSLDRFRVIADWYHLPILELIDLPEQEFTYDDIARILHLKTEQVETAIGRLLKLGLVTTVENSDGQIRYRTTSNETIAGDEGADIAVQHCHEGFLNMQSQAALRKPVEERESLSFSIGIAKEDWTALRKKLQKAVVSVLTQYATTEKPKNQVACCSMQVITLLPNNETDQLGNVIL